MRANWTWVGAVFGLCASAACSGDGTTQPVGSREVNPPAVAAPTNALPGSPVSTPTATSGAAGAFAPASNAVPPTAANPSTPDVRPPAEPSASGVPIGPGAPLVPDQPTFVRDIPTDVRQVSTVDKTAPISGGTLAITADDRYAVASDPDRDRVSIVDLATGLLTATVALQAGDEPGRVAIDASNRAHVALRRGGAVVTIEPKTGKVLERRDVCAAPRGVAFEPTNQRVLVACRSGELVSLPMTGTTGITRNVVASDLRDVIVRSNGVFVSRFKTAELIAVDLNGAVKSTAQPSVIHQLFPESDGSTSVDGLDPLGARSTRGVANGTMIMLHQTARQGDITLEPEGASVNPMGGSSAYGGSGSCSGVAGSAVTTFDGNGKVVSTVQLAVGALPVDIARSSQTDELAVAMAGATDPFQPSGSVVISSSDPAVGTATIPSSPPTGPGSDVTVATMGVMRFSRSGSNSGAMIGDATAPMIDGTQITGICIGADQVVGTPGPATAVAYTSDERLIIQVREPPTIVVAPVLTSTDGFLPTQISLGGVSVLDTGHEIFNRDAGAGVACATCHLEGDEDGHTWHFAGQGPRRTQALSVGLEGTAPFHWVGDMTDLGKLMENVFVGRMGGVHQSPARLDALAHFLFAIRAPAPLRAANDAAAMRGHDLFVGQAECSKCHEGPKLTNNQTVDVGTGVALQVPSLVGVGVRGPWLHTGCAKTLQQRFDPACGGNTHGKTAQLTAAQIDDVVAYLETL